MFEAPAQYLEFDELRSERQEQLLTKSVVLTGVAKMYKLPKDKITKEQFKFYADFNYLKFHPVQGVKSFMPKK